MGIGSGAGGFAAALLPPGREERRPAEGTVTDFEVWWADGRRQVRLKPSDPR
ncbi:hypothetical protein ACFYZN_32795 [Streptomyces sp. NPDC001777]|uniref:hypothetical protein n=1 Tax=Streptomyces sp. NPDC001777 TaxID=3364608 RepID=UPI0036BF9679